MKTTIIVTIFCFTYVLIAARRLRLLPIGRPAGALLGAVLMVASGALTPEQSYACVNYDTIVLLFGTMLLTVYLDEAGFFEGTATAILSLFKTPWRILVSLSVLAALLSAFLVNDTVCLFLTPVVVSICRKCGLPPVPYLIALATSSNIGSAATLVGNPQNMIIGSLSKISFSKFLWWSAPASAVGMVINIALLYLFYYHRLPREFNISEIASTGINRPRFTLVASVVVLVVAGFFGGFHLGYTAVAGCLILIVTDHKDPRASFGRVDWPLLIFFSSLFIVTKAFATTGILDRSWAYLATYMKFSELSGVIGFSLFMTVGSQFISNVPMVLLSGPHVQMSGCEFGWVLMAFTTTVAGNLTIIGSVANIIVAERAKDYYTLGFWEYLRFGFVSTILVLTAGVSILYAFSRLN